MRKFMPGRLGLFLSVLAVTAAAPCFASSFEEGWDFRAQAGFGPMAIDARSTVKGQSASFVSGSSDLLAFETTALKIRLEAWKGRWGITADNTLANFEAQSRIDSANTVTLSGRDSSTELGGSYMLIERNMAKEMKLMCEGMAGGRFVVMKQTLDFSSGVHESDRKKYVDPFVGARVTWIISKILSADVRGNVGGFGIGSGSELTWMVVPELNIHLAKSTIINVGYRHYDVRTEKETGNTPSQFDGKVYGTFLGVEVRFK